jgi:hypothetical protein
MYYIINRETEKLELHFDKSEYQALSDDQKSTIKSNFLFSRYGGCWVSRAKIPNLWRAEQVAKSLGAENQGKTGELLSFEEKMERKAARAEERAERMDARADAAEQRGEQLQKPINARRGDIAFFTQPNINTSSGRTFTRQREKMFAAFERGMDEFKKSEYYAERAEAARRTANLENSKDKAFCDRRVKDAQKNIKAIQKNLDHYHAMLECDGMGEQQKRFDGTPIERAEIERWIEDAEERLESEISRLCYYQSCIDDLGGVQFSKENIKPGYVVKIKHYNNCTVLRTGPKNIIYRTPNGFNLTAAYAEILEIVKAEETIKPTHPFKVGETFEIGAYVDGHRVKQVWEIVKSTATTVTLKNQTTGENIRRTPKIRWTCEGDKWALCIGDYIDSMFYRSI